MQRLDDEGLAENTVVIFIGDNGRCHLRGKCWLYDAGLKVPFLLKIPNAFTGRFQKENSEHTVDDLVSTLDISATVLDLAGVKLPEYLDGRSLVSQDYEPREAVFAARDLIDEVLDRIRCVRTKQFKYIRNYKPENGYRECVYVRRNRPMLAIMEELGRQKQLTPAQELILAKLKPREELYDVEADPHEIHNLAEDPKYAETLASLRDSLDDWIQDTGDTGLEQQATMDARKMRNGK
jgi:arylsulfatase A-like enzyme